MKTTGYDKHNLNLQNEDLLLLEGALGERLKQEYHLVPDPHIALAGFALKEQGRQALRKIWTQYLQIAHRYDLPFLAATPTRRANKERLAKAGLDSTVITANVALLKEVQANCNSVMYVGGLMGCRGDAYTGDGALSAIEACRLHSWQAFALQQAGVDFLMAGLMPTLPEAIGMAQAMAATGLPYFISFTLRPDGRIIDGTTLASAIAALDAAVPRKPECYLTNCIHPRLVYQALSQPFNRTPLVHSRFLGIQANTSPLSYSQLDHAAELFGADPQQLSAALHCSDPDELAAAMLRLKTAFGLKIFGGCCGTDQHYLEAIAQKITTPLHK